MANDLNQCTFVGRLGKAPEIRYTQSGKAVASFSIAVGWKSKDKEGAEWVNITAWDKLAEICGEYLVKGSQVLIVGRFTTEKWEDKDGNDRYSVKIIAERMQMLGSRPDTAADEDQGSKQGRPPRPQRRQQVGDGGQQYREAREGSRPAPQQSSAPNFADMDDDIPFSRPALIDGIPFRNDGSRG